MSVTLLIISGMCDMVDGFVAKKLKRTYLEKQFGIQLDTVVDVISFGITPVIIVFSTVRTTWYALLVYVFYVICAAIRLAYFNTTAAPDKPTIFYRGLPVTCIALILPVVLLFQSVRVSIVTFATVAILYILNIKMPKPRGVWYIVFLVIAAALITLWWCI